MHNLASARKKLHLGCVEMACMPLGQNLGCLSWDFLNLQLLGNGIVVANMKQNAGAATSGVQSVLVAPYRRWLWQHAALVVRLPCLLSQRCPSPPLAMAWHHQYGSRFIGPLLLCSVCTSPCVPLYVIRESSQLFVVHWLCLSQLVLVSVPRYLFWFIQHRSE